jgi:4-hydroxy-4-methyl-2-oxoglutarate aldolase
MQATARADVERLRAFDGPTISDAVENLTKRDRTTGFTGSEIRCLGPDLVPVAGFAVTAMADCTTPGPPPKDQGKRPELWRLIDASPKPVIVVIQHVDNHPERGSVMGDVVTTIAMRCGAVGLVTNAAVRDYPPMREMGFAVFSRGTVTSRGNNYTISVGHDVTVGGMTVGMGDIVFGDSNGVVMIPRDLPLTDLFAEIERVRADDAARIAEIKAPGYRP